MDVEKIAKKSKLAKEMVRLGISKNFEEASKRIDDENLVKGSVNNANKTEKIEEKEIEGIERIESTEQAEETSIKIAQQEDAPPITTENGQENLNMMVKRINLMELQLNQAHEKIEKSNQKNSIDLNQLKETVLMIQATINELKKEWKSGKYRQDPQRELEIKEKKKERREEPKNPRTPDESDGFDPSVENIFNNSGDRLVNKGN